MQRGGRGQHHQHAAGQARGEAPQEEPGERQWPGAGGQRDGSKQHHSVDRRPRARGARHRPSGHGARQVTGKVRRAQVGRAGSGEPVRAHQRRQQRRIGKARETDADQTCTEARQGGSPGRNRLHLHGYRHVSSPKPGRSGQPVTMVVERDCQGAAGAGATTPSGRPVAGDTRAPATHPTPSCRCPLRR